MNTRIPSHLDAASRLGGCRTARGLKVVLALLALCMAGGVLSHAAQREPSPELFAPGIISTGDFELGITFSADGREVFFTKISPAGFTTSVLMTSRLRNGRWSEPEVLPFASQYRDIDPALSPDGRRLFFQSDRPVSGAAPKDWDIWVAERDAQGKWGEPRNLGAPVNTSSVETYPFVAADGTLYFASDRPGGLGAVDIYRAGNVSVKFEQVQNLSAPFNSAGGDSNFAYSPDGTIFVKASSDLPGHRGEGDLYLSRLRDGKWSEFTHLGAINTPAREFAPAFSPDGKYLYFTSTRMRAGAAYRTARELASALRSPQNGLGDIYRIEVSALPR